MHKLKTRALHHLRKHVMVTATKWHSLFSPQLAIRNLWNCVWILKLLNKPFGKLDTETKFLQNFLDWRFRPIFERRFCRYPSKTSLPVGILTCTFRHNWILRSCNPLSFSLILPLLLVSSASYPLPRHSWLLVFRRPLTPRCNIHFRFSWPQSIGQATGSNTPRRVVMERIMCFEKRREQHGNSVAVQSPWHRHRWKTHKLKIHNLN
jgi:hypothetical protein